MSDDTFKDYFSGHAAAYARYRPDYPAELFRLLASLCDEHERAWDCGTGSGQAAHGLLPYFARIVATDASARQLEHAVPHEHITYRVAPAEHSPLASRSVDLVTVAQALHWFDFDAFFNEVRRVLKPGGVVAVWTYGLFSITPPIDAVIERYYADVVGAYWPPERRYVDAGYRTIPFPFDELRLPRLELHAEWDLDQVLGYLGTWSATQRFVAERGTDPLDEVRGALREAWGEAAKRRHVRWPLPLRAGRLATGSEAEIS